MPLYDEGGDSEQGEQLFSSGFWLNKYIFEWEGEAEATLLAVGSYRGEEFLLEKKLGQTTVRNPGEISLTLGDADLYTAPGRILYIPVTVENRSSFDELLLIDLTGDESFSVLDHELRLAPGETRHFRLAIAVNSLLETGPGVLQLTFQAGNSLTAVEPVSLRLPVEILPRPAYLGRLLLDPTALPTALKVLLLCGLLVYGGGLLLYRLLVYSRERLGELVYWKEGSGYGPPAGSEKIKLSRASGKKAVISFSPAGKADFNITGGSCGYDLVFEVELPGIRPWPLFLQGWQALLQKPLPPEKVVKSTPPGVIEVGGGIFTRKRLFNGDVFQSGGYSFKYLDSYTKRPVQKGDGSDVLEGKG